MIGLGSSLRLRLLCQRITAFRYQSAQSQARQFRFSPATSAAAAVQLLASNRWNTNVINFRQINTTKKNKDTHNSVDIFDPNYVDVKKPEGPKTAAEFADVKSQKNWISFGFDYVDPAEDRHLMNLFFFVFITLGCITFSYFLYYYPDIKLNDWALREAFIELDRRERLGLPLVSPDLVDPAKLQLPTDEELGDYEVYL